MEKRNEIKWKHLTEDDSIRIAKLLSEGLRFSRIGEIISKDPTTSTCSCSQPLFSYRILFTLGILRKKYAAAKQSGTQITAINPNFARGIISRLRISIAINTIIGQ